MSTPPSPASSATSSPTMSRRVSTRKGSMSAADPWGTHTEMNMNPSLSSSCKLTIVRVVNPAPVNPPQLDEAPPSPQHRRHFGFGNSHPHRRHGSSSSVGSNSSIGPIGKGDGPQRLSFASSTFAAAGSPTGSGPRDRPSSPTAMRPHSPNGHHHRHRSSLSSSKARLSPDQLINLAHQSTHPRAIASPAHSPLTPCYSNGAVANSDMSPASFTPLPDEIFLPFIDRASEVSALLSGPPSGKLLTLLAQTFPISPPSNGDQDPDALYTLDPAQWLYSQLHQWLTTVDRDVAPDPIWVARARRCILSHSELIWERIKGALGVPPELDVDGDTEDLGPINIYTDFDFAHSPADIDSHQDMLPVPAPHGAGDMLTDSMVGSLSPEPSAIATAPSADHDHDRISPLPDSSSASPPLSLTGLSISPVIAATASSPETSDHERLPPTRPGAHRMHDISEDVLEEKDEDAAEDTPAQSASASPRQVVQGICIRTALASPGLFGSPPPLSSIPALPLDDRDERPLLVRRVSGSPVRERDGSLGRYSFTAQSAAGAGYAGSTASSDVPYDAVAERGPGNPLFPSSFARLALGPTLSANNPLLRSPLVPPPPAFGNPHAIRASARGRRAVPSWAESWDPLKHEYALTVGSESSFSAP